MVYNEFNLHDITAHASKRSYMEPSNRTSISFLLESFVLNTGNRLLLVVEGGGGHSRCLFAFLD